MDADQKQPNRAGGVWNRLWSFAWRRRPPHPSIASVMAQWAEYELIFNDILQRLNAQLARQAKYEKAALARLAAEGGTGEVDGSDGSVVTPVPILSAKAALRSRVAQEKFGGRVQAILEAKESRNVDSGTGG